MKKVWFFILVLFIQVASFAQDSGYTISVQLDGYPDGPIFLGNYFGDKLAITDTAVSNKGTINFSGDMALRQGVSTGYQEEGQDR